ncbi:hypothetical protein pb186bvf_015821 [Paramecium bursaria]
MAVHDVVKERVAVKIIDKSKLLTTDDLQRLQREILILRKVKHNNVIQLYEILESPKCIYLVMEYADEGYLLQDQQVYNEQKAIYYFHQLIEGVEYLHQNNIYHRDLKPENILISSGYVKIIDFGLSLLSNNDLLNTNCGSLLYASPEKLRGQQYGGQKSDIWSCGVVLYQMLQGKLPFYSTEKKKLLQMISNEQFQINKPINHTVYDLLNQLLQKDPDNRISLESIKIILDQGLWPKPDTRYYQLILDSSIFDHLKELGFDVNEIKKSLTNQKHNSLTACYYLIRIQKLKELMKTKKTLNLKAKHIEYQIDLKLNTNNEPQIYSVSKDHIQQQKNLNDRMKTEQNREQRSTSVNFRRMNRNKPIRQQMYQPDQEKLNIICGNLPAIKKRLDDRLKSFYYSKNNSFLIVTNTQKFPKY